MKDKLINLFSRKFILTALATLIGIATFFSNNGDTKVQIVGLIVVLFAQVVYNIVEGNIDAKSVAAQAAATMKKINELLNAFDIEESTEVVVDTDTKKALDAVKEATESGTVNQ